MKRHIRTMLAGSLYGHIEPFGSRGASLIRFVASTLSVWRRNSGGVGHSDRRILRSAKPPTVLHHREVDSCARSIYKAVTYRLVGSAATALLMFFLGGKNLAVSIGAGSLDVVLKAALYYLHERVWDQIGIGRAKARADNGEL